MLRKSPFEKRKKIDIENSLRQCEEDCSINPSPEIIVKLETLNDEHRARWYELGDKSNMYFLNLENHKRAKSAIWRIFTKGGFLTSDPRKIMNGIEEFYSDLYRFIHMKTF